jgi:hypothetical protein
MNPRIGSGAQQTRERPEEEAAEVVRDHEGGTCGGGGTLFAEARPQGRAGVDSGSHVDEGEPGGTRSSQEPSLPDESQERKVRFTLTRAVQEL